MSNTKNTTTTRTRKSYSLRRVVDMILNHDATWADVEAYTNLKRGTVQRYLREDHYTTEKGRKTDYQTLLDTARENEKRKKEVANLLTVSPAEEEDIHEVIVTETGYLMKVGIGGIMSESLDIIIPSFCVGELEKLSRNFSSAEEVLTFIWSNERITRLNLKKEILFEEPTSAVKDRTLGIVAVVCHLYSNGIKVRLLTTSYEVFKLAKAQGFPPEDVKVEFVNATK